MPSAQASRRPHRRRRRPGPERRHPRRRQVRLQRRHRVHRPRRQLRRPDRAEPLAPAHAARRHRHPAPRRHDPRHRQPRQSVRTRRSTTSDGHAQLLGSRHRDVPPDGARRPHRASAATARSRSRTSSASCGIPIVGVPKTIDNDIVGTTNCFGFDTAVAFATDAIDRLHTTAEAHRRIMVVEVMGRYAGWIALLRGRRRRRRRDSHPGDPVRHRQRRPSGCASATSWGAQLQHRRRRRRRVSEGRQRCRSSRPRTHGYVERLGGIGAQVCDALASETGKETRSVVLGHLQRGGAPTSFDRVLATRFGGKAVELIMRGRVRHDGGVRSARHRGAAARRGRGEDQDRADGSRICC